jgi:hypothetical protein
VSHGLCYNQSTPVARRNTKLGTDNLFFHVLSGVGCPSSARATIRECMKGQVFVMAICRGCSKDFAQNRTYQIYCTKACRESNKYIHIPNRYATTIPTASTGAVSEMIVCADLLERGYEVFRAVSAASSCDILAMKGNQYVRVEVRTCYINPWGEPQFPKKDLDIGRSDVYAAVTKDHQIFYIPDYII